MTNKPLNARAQKALEVLEAGGQFVERLERNSYTGREQFRTRLIAKGGSIVKGIGAATKRDLNDRIRIVSSTTVSTYFGLPYVYEPAKVNWDF